MCSTAPSRGPYVEGDPIAPINSYGRSKAAGERAVRETTPLHVIMRTSWVYGEFGQNFLKTMLRLAATRDELRVVADQRGCPTSTPDLAGAILAIAPQLARRRQDLGHLSFRRLRRDDVARICQPHRRRAGAADRTRAARHRRSPPRNFRRLHAGRPIRNSIAACSSASSGSVDARGPTRPTRSRAHWSARNIEKEPHVA